MEMSSNDVESQTEEETFANLLQRSLAQENKSLGIISCTKLVRRSEDGGRSLTRSKSRASIVNESVACDNETAKAPLLMRENGGGLVCGSLTCVILYAAWLDSQRRKSTPRQEVCTPIISEPRVLRDIHRHTYCAQRLLGRNASAGLVEIIGQEDVEQFSSNLACRHYANQSTTQLRLVAR